jgi:hypothetical protein
MNPAFGNLNSQTLATTDWLSSRVEDMMTCILTQSTIVLMLKDFGLLN